LRLAATSADLSVVVRSSWGKEGKEVRFDESGDVHKRARLEGKRVEGREREKRVREDAGGRTTCVGSVDLLIS
jgi:hypothetical protein